MGLTLGDGLAILSVVSFIIACLYRFVSPARLKTNQPCPPSKSPLTCPEHATISSDMGKVKASLLNLENGIHELKTGQTETHKRLNDFINKFVKV